MWRMCCCLLGVLINKGVVPSSFWWLMLWFWVKYKIRNLILEVVGFFLFYRIFGSVSWGVVRGVGDEVDRDICYGVDIDVGDDVESENDGKVEL